MFVQFRMLKIHVRFMVLILEIKVVVVALLFL